MIVLMLVGFVGLGFVLVVGITFAAQWVGKKRYGSSNLYAVRRITRANRRYRMQGLLPGQCACGRARCGRTHEHY